MNPISNPIEIFLKPFYGLIKIFSYVFFIEITKKTA